MQIKPKLNGLMVCAIPSVGHTGKNRILMNSTLPSGVTEELGRFDIKHVGQLADNLQADVEFRLFDLA